MSDEPATPPDADTDADTDEDDEEFIPYIVLAKLGELAAWMPEGVAKKFADRPVWFILEEDQELVGLFDRVPEDPMSKGQIEVIMKGLRSFAADRAEALQALLGPTDGIGVGFHVDATMERVKKSFEEDGFEISGTIEDGEVVG